MQFDVGREFMYPHADLLGTRAVSEPQRYPQAGTPNAQVKIGVVAGARRRDEMDGGWRNLEHAIGSRGLVARFLSTRCRTALASSGSTGFAILRSLERGRRAP